MINRILFFTILSFSLGLGAEPMDLKDANPDIQRAVSYIDKNRRLTEAFDILNAEKEKDPDNPLIYTQMARYVMAVNGRYGDRGLNQARLLLDQALNLDLKRADTYVLYGYVDWAQGKYPQALAKLQKAEELGTTNSWLYVQKARALHGLGRLDDAIQILEDLVFTEPFEDKRAINAAAGDLKDIYTQAGFVNKVDEAYKVRIRISDRKEWLYHEYALFLLKNRGDFENAITYTKEALRINKFLVAQRFLAVALSIKAGHVYKVEGDKEYAWELIQEAERQVGRLEATMYKAGNFYNDINAVLALAEYGVDINWEEQSMGNTTFNQLTMICDTDQLKALIEAGGDIHINTGFGTTLHQVLRNSTNTDGLLSKVELLLDHGARLDIVDRFGNTPLSLARYGTSGNHISKERQAVMREVVKLMEAHQEEENKAEMEEVAI